MNKKKFVFTLIFCVVLCAIIIVQRYNADNKSIEYKNEEISSKVVSIHKPKNAKLTNVVFSDSTELIPFSDKFKNRIEIGDSVFKAANSLTYIIYKAGKINDTLKFYPDIAWEIKYPKP